MFENAVVKLGIMQNEMSSNMRMVYFLKHKCFPARLHTLKSVPPKWFEFSWSQKCRFTRIRVPVQLHYPERWLWRGGHAPNPHRFLNKPFSINWLFPVSSFTLACICVYVHVYIHVCLTRHIYVCMCNMYITDKHWNTLKLQSLSSVVIW